MTGENSTALAAALAAMSDGIMVFDARLRLAACNARPFEMLDLPLNLAAPGTHFYEILQYQAARGEFGEDGPAGFAPLLASAEAGESANFTREFSNGRIVEFKRNPIAGGGFVVVYTDVTERARVARAAARETRRLTEALEAFGEGFALLDADERLVMWNPRYAEIYSAIGTELRRGGKFEDLVRALATSPVSRVPPDKVEAHVADRLDRIRNPRPAADVERADGSWVRIIDRRTTDGSTVLIRIDVTDIKRREAALAAINAAFAKLLSRPGWRRAVEGLLGKLGNVMGVSRVKLGRNGLENGRLVQTEIFEWTAEGVPRLMGSGPAVARPFALDAFADWRERLTRGEAIAVDVASLEPAKREALAALGLRSVLRIPVMAGESWWGTVGFDQCDVERHWTPTEIDTLGAAASFVGLAIERNLSEKALRDSEERFRVIAESHPVPVVVVEIASSIVRYASPPVFDLLRAEPGTLIGASISPLWTDIADRKRFLTTVEATGAVDGVEFALRRLDGTVFPGAISARRIVYEGVPCTVGAIVDLTQPKAIESQMARQREALHQSEKMAALGSLLAGVAHELNNPLAIVVGQASLLEATAADARTVDRAKRIAAAADRCGKIVRSFLAMARRKAPERAPVDIAATIDSTLDLLGYLLRSTGVEVERRLADGLPRVMGDGGQIGQVVSNLVVNAQQALGERAAPRRLRISAAPGADAKSVRIEIADNGPGVPEELRARIFDPFFTTKPEGVGTGVGLSVCKGIVESHDGRIEADTAPEGGALFTVVLPAAAPGAAAPAAAAAPEAAPGRGHRMLVVDDEPGIAATLAEILESGGAAVDIAYDGAQALSLIAQQRYDAIFSDLRMPGMDGPALYRAVLQRDPALAAKMAFVTGDTLSGDASGTFAATGVPLIDKPFQAADIRAVASKLAAR